jgi:hypothetical protein
MTSTTITPTPVSDSVPEFAYLPNVCDGMYWSADTSCKGQNPGRKVVWKNEHTHLCNECYHSHGYSYQMRFTWYGPPAEDPKYKFVCQPGWVTDVYHHADPCTRGPEIAKILDDMEIGLQAIERFRGIYCRERGSELTREIGWNCMDGPKVAICHLQDKILRGKARMMGVSLNGSKGFRLRDDEQSPSSNKKAKLSFKWEGGSAALITE